MAWQTAEHVWHVLVALVMVPTIPALHRQSLTDALPVPSVSVLVGHCRQLANAVWPGVGL